MGVTLDGHAMDTLPQNGQGQSYVDLFSPVTRWRQRIPLAYQVDDGEHVLELTVLERGNLASEGNVIAVDAFEVATGERSSFPAGVTAFLGLAMVAVGGLTYREWRVLRRKHG